jgi:hypothetical protein
MALNVYSARNFAGPLSCSLIYFDAIRIYAHDLFLFVSVVAVLQEQQQFSRRSKLIDSKFR